MSMDELSTDRLKRGHQRPVVRPSWAYMAFGAVTLMVSLVLGVVWLIQERFYEGEITPPPSTEDLADTIPAPRLQSSPARDLAILQARAAAILNGYGWVDRSQGIVHIPIERAMDLVVDRGLDQLFQRGAAASTSQPPDTQEATERPAGAGARPSQQSTLDAATSKARAVSPPPDRPALPARQGLESLVEAISPEETGAVHAPGQEPTVDKEEPPSLGGPWPLPGEEAPP